MKLLNIVHGDIGKFKVLWKKWDIRTFIVASFTFQLLLILIAPFRRRSSRLVIRVSTWLSYLLADWVAAQAVGLITRATEISDAESELFALWAQFLLVHLGGPDTITALALEDNALWLRTGLHLGTLAYATLGILVRSARDSSLWFPMLLMFLAGTIKYLERVMSLFHGRLMELDEEPVDEYVKRLVEDGRRSKVEPMSNVEMVRGAFCLFNSYKRLYADLQINGSLRKDVRDYFLTRRPEEAYGMVEVQLNFMYEAMYTKASVIHRTAWTILRHLVLSLELASLVIWCFFTDKRGYSGHDIRITHALVVGAAAVDGLALLRIHLSDWSVARLKRGSRVRSWLYNSLLSARRDRNSSRGTASMRSWFRRVFLARWSESIYQIPFTYIDLGVVEKAMTALNMVHFSIRQVFLSKKPISSEMWDFIFEVLTKPCESGQYSLPDGETPVGVDVLVATALPLDILEYDAILFPWYEATSYQSQQQVRYADQVYRDISTTIADYMIYLYVLQPTMMFATAGKEHVLGSYYNLQKSANVDISFSKYRVEGGEGRCTKFGILTCELETDSDNDHVLANRNMEEVIEYVKDGEKWEVIARVWVELLCHAAITCRPNVHANQLKEGGEFLSFVWLLMLHLGIGPKTHTRV